MFTLRFDMRAPTWGANPAALYAAAPEMCAWAEDHGCLAAVLCEHHGSEDGYLPSPLLLASAIAARTQRLVLSMILILPFYDAVRLAEDMAVLDILSDGRASYILALGYRPEEYEHFGLALGDRGRLADEKLALLRRLLAGETVVEDRRRIMVTPRPQTAGGPALAWGGGSLAAARRAGRYGLGLLANANVAGMREAYEAACQKHGHPPGPACFPTATTPRCASSPMTSSTPGRSLASICCTMRVTVCRVEPRQSDIGGILTRDDSRRVARCGGVARDYSGFGSDLAGSRGRDTQPGTLVRWVGTGNRVAISQTRGRDRAP